MVSGPIIAVTPEPVGRLQQGRFRLYWKTDLPGQEAHRGGGDDRLPGSQELIFPVVVEKPNVGSATSLRVFSARF